MQTEILRQKHIAIRQTNYSSVSRAFLGRCTSVICAVTVATVSKTQIGCSTCESYEVGLVDPLVILGQQPVSSLSVWAAARPLPLSDLFFIHPSVISQLWPQVEMLSHRLTTSEPRLGSERLTLLHQQSSVLIHVWEELENVVEAMRTNVIFFPER